MNDLPQQPIEPTPDPAKYQINSAHLPVLRHTWHSRIRALFGLPHPDLLPRTRKGEHEVTGEMVEVPMRVIRGIGTPEEKYENIVGIYDRGSFAPPKQ